MARLIFVVLRIKLPLGKTPQVLALLRLVWVAPCFPSRRVARSKLNSVLVFSPVARTSRQAKRRRFSSWTRCRCFTLRSAFRLLGRSLTWPSIPNRAGSIATSLLWGGTPAGPRHARARLASPELLSILSLQPRQGAPCALRDLRQDHPGRGALGAPQQPVSYTHLTLPTKRIV